MTAITFVQTMPWRALARRWNRNHWRWMHLYGTAPKDYTGRHRHTTHEGVTARSVPLAELMPAEGVLRDDLHEDITDLVIDADRMRAEAAERGNDTSDDVTGGIDPEIHKANKPVFAQMLADFDAAYNAIVDRFNNEPKAPGWVLLAAEHTQEIDMRVLRRELVAAAASGLAA